MGVALVRDGVDVGVVADVGWGKVIRVMPFGGRGGGKPQGEPREVHAGHLEGVFQSAESAAAVNEGPRW